MQKRIAETTHCNATNACAAIASIAWRVFLALVCAVYGIWKATKQRKSCCLKHNQMQASVFVQNVFGARNIAPRFVPRALVLAACKPLIYIALSHNAHYVK